MRGFAILYLVVGIFFLVTGVVQWIVEGPGISTPDQLSVFDTLIIAAIALASAALVIWSTVDFSRIKKEQEENS